MARSGAQDIYVEPDIGDIQATVGGIEYVIECSMIVPPLNESNFANEVFRSVLNQIRHGNAMTWIDVTFHKYPHPNDISKVVKSIKEAHFKFDKVQSEVIDVNSDYTVKVSAALQQDMDNLSKKMADGVWDFGYKMVMHSPKTPNDIYSVDLDEPPTAEKGLFTISGLINNQEKKTTRERLRAKLKQKKSQTKNVPAPKRRMYIFMSDGKVENDDCNDIARTFSNDVKPTDNIDAIIFTDRRHQTYANKLRYPSGQVHFYTTDKRVPHLEQLCLSMKQFEMSDWIAE